MPEEEIINSIKQSKKYSSIDLPDDLMLHILEQEKQKFSSPKKVEEAMRKKLHNIVAPYLDKTDYLYELSIMDNNIKPEDPFKTKAYCTNILSKHASTKERLPILDTFYATLFSLIGKPHSILDLACGLNPFTLPWMPLDKTMFYYAYDIHKPRIDFINRFFSLYGLPQLAVHQDILVTPPIQESDTAFFFKEAHRFEKRKPGCNRTFWQALNVKTILVSLPTEDLKHHHNLVPRHRQFIEKTTQGLNWMIDELLFPKELVFVIWKN